MFFGCKLLGLPFKHTYTYMQQTIPKTNFNCPVVM